MHSGFNIWTLQSMKNMEFNPSFKTKHLGREITLRVDPEREYVVNTSDMNNPNRADGQAISQIINVVIKNAMGEAGLIQYGQRSRFFDASRPLDIHSLGMQIWPGFKTSAYKYQDGCALIVDNCSRFMSTRSVLESMMDLRQKFGDSDKRW